MGNLIHRKFGVLWQKKWSGGVYIRESSGPVWQQVHTAP